jgi:neutral ceramidase
MAALPGLQIKEAGRLSLRVKRPVIGGLADERISYMLLPDEYDSGGGHEASVSCYGRTLGTVIVDGAIENVSRLNSR